MKPSSNDSVSQANAPGGWGLGVMSSRERARWLLRVSVALSFWLA